MKKNHGIGAFCDVDLIAWLQFIFIFIGKNL
jgi:hypothetical protein